MGGVVVVGCLLLIVIVTGLAVLLSGGSDDSGATVSVATSSASSAELPDSDTSGSTAAAGTVAPPPSASVAPSPATTVLSVTPANTAGPELQEVSSTHCFGTTDTGFVPVAFMTAFTADLQVNFCRFAGRWFLAAWTNSSGAQEAALFNIDQPLTSGMPLPLLMATPAGCIADRVQDPAIATALSEGFPFAACGA
jgi:hypothetical protein